MRKQGFTILEILVVLAVLAILIGIAVPRIKGMQDQGNIQKAKSELKTLQAAVEAYNINHGAYPASVTTLGTFLASESVKIVPGAMVDPFIADGTEYKYVFAPPYYIIWSAGPGAARTITGINASGVLQGTLGDDICITNSSDASVDTECIH